MPLACTVVLSARQYPECRQVHPARTGSADADRPLLLESGEADLRGRRPALSSPNSVRAVHACGWGTSVVRTGLLSPVLRPGPHRNSRESPVQSKPTPNSSCAQNNLRSSLQIVKYVTRLCDRDPSARDRAPGATYRNLSRTFPTSRRWQITPDFAPFHPSRSEPRLPASAHLSKYLIHNDIESNHTTPGWPPECLNDVVGRVGSAVHPSTPNPSPSS